jgi:formylglycine-generating enzyme required for sulfatase activity
MGHPGGFLTRLILAVLLAGPCFCGPAYADKRIALVIGNGRYVHANTLPNPPNDARAVAKALGGIGFKVMQGVDLDRDSMERLLRDFLGQASTAEVALLFYAGHGLQVDGRNYLIPVDAKIETATDLNFGTVDLDKILASLDDPARANIIILDACRDNPLARSFAARTRSASVGSGLAAYTALGTGTLIAFSTAPGKVAEDGGAANSPFTTSLVRHIATPGIEVRQMLTRVRSEVALATGEKQVPWDNSSLRGDVYLGAPPVAGPAADEISWSFVKDTKDPDQLRRFATAYPKSPHLGEATTRIAMLESQAAEERRKADEERNRQAAAAAPVPPAVPPRPAPCGGGAVTVSLASRCATPLSAAEERSLKPKDSFKECDGCPEMVVVPAGSFTMGSPDSEKDRHDDEVPQHRVTIGKPFAVGKFHVTVDQFAAFVMETGYDAGPKCYAFEGGKWEEKQGRFWRNPGFSQNGSHPAVCLNWNDAEAYVAWLARKTGKAYRLLTESEWEYAARARTEPGAYPRYSFGNDAKDLCRYGNGADQTAKDGIEGTKGWTVAPCNDGYAYTSPVGNFTANGFGLFDMQGNAWQWTVDCYHDSYTGAPSDASAWTTGDCGRRVVRGGSWDDLPRGLRAAFRFRYSSGFRDSRLGFRLGRTLTP